MMTSQNQSAHNERSCLLTKAASIGCIGTIMAAIIGGVFAVLAAIVGSGGFIESPSPNQVNTRAASEKLTVNIVGLQLPY